MADSVTPAIKVLVLAGGLGTRLRPLTDHVPKCLVPIGGRPLLDYWFDLFAEAGIRDVLINTHHHRDAVQEYIASKNATGRFVVSETVEPVLLGSAGTIHANPDWVSGDEHCLIVYADNLSNLDLRSLLRFHAVSGAPMTMVLFRTARPTQCGIATLDGSGTVVAFVEKPKTPPGDLANAGVYVASAATYQEMAALDRFDLGFDVLPTFVGRMIGYVWDGYHRDIGDVDSLRWAEHDVTEGLLRRPAAPPPHGDGPQSGGGP